MLLNFLVAPDFAPKKAVGWNMLNTKWQRDAEVTLHLLTPTSAPEQEQLLTDKTIDLVYANPFDAVTLIREKGYIPFARPVKVSDEMVICASHDSQYNEVEDIKSGCKIALTNNYDVKLIGLRLIEPADLKEEDVEWQMYDSFQGAMRAVIENHADIGFCMLDVYKTLTNITRSQLKVLVESGLFDIHHVLLLHPSKADIKDRLAQSLLKTSVEQNNLDIMAILGFEKGFELITQEDAEFMIDLMETLKD